MKIELLNVRIFISKSTVVTDAIGNRRNEWKPFYTCYATVSGEAGKEQTDAGMVVDDSNIDFTIRWCKKAAEIDSTHFRVEFNGGALQHRRCGSHELQAQKHQAVL